MIGITLGEYYGVGPEILIKTFVSMGKSFPSCKIYGSEKLLEKKCKELKVSPFWKNSKTVELIECEKDSITKENSKARAQYVLRTLDAAMAEAKNKTITGIITCPIDKSVIKSVIPDFTGHTEYLAEKSRVGLTVMMLCNSDFNIALLTNHVSLRHVSEKLKVNSLENVIRTACESYKKHFKISKPKMAVLGINPHAGELDAEAEEKTVFESVLQKFKSEGMDLQGPFPADSFFPKGKGAWDIVFSPYHDQGLVAAKYNGLHDVVNVTLGMPFLRISPGHGTAYDIVDRNVADHRSLEKAIRVMMNATRRSC